MVSEPGQAERDEKHGNTYQECSNKNNDACCALEKPSHYGDVAQNFYEWTEEYADSYNHDHEE